MAAFIAPSPGALCQAQGFCCGARAGSSEFITRSLSQARGLGLLFADRSHGGLVWARQMALCEKRHLDARDQAIRGAPALAWFRRPGRAPCRAMAMRALAGSRRRRRSGAHARTPRPPRRWPAASASACSPAQSSGNGRRWAKEPGSGGMVSIIQLPLEAGETAKQHRQLMAEHHVLPGHAVLQHQDARILRGRVGGEHGASAAQPGAQHVHTACGARRATKAAASRKAASPGGRGRWPPGCPRSG